MTTEQVTFETISDSALKAEMNLKAAPEKVFDAWTKAEVLPKWFGPTSGSLQIDRFDCTAGGGYDLTMLFSDGDRVQLVGEYLEVESPRKIVFTWRWIEGEKTSNETLVTVDLAPSGSGTHLTLTHERFADIKSRDDHQSGWASCLARLENI